MTLDDARRLVTAFVQEYNEVRLHSAISYVTPKNMLEGRQEAILAERDRKLEQARERRGLARQQQRKQDSEKMTDDTQIAGYNPDTQPVPGLNLPGQGQLDLLLTVTRKIPGYGAGPIQAETMDIELNQVKR